MTWLLDLERVGARQLIDADAGRLLAVEAEKLAVGLRAEFDAADVAQARDLAVIAGLDDDVLELIDVGEPPCSSIVYWKSTPGGVGGMPT